MYTMIRSMQHKYQSLTFLNPKRHIRHLVRGLRPEEHVAGGLCGPTLLLGHRQPLRTQNQQTQRQ